MIILKAENDKINLFNINKPGKSINSSKKILFKGYFSINKSELNWINEIDITKKHKKVKIDSNELIKILKKQKIIISNCQKDLVEFLNHHQIKFTQQDICDLCLTKNKIKFLSNNNTYHTIHLKYCKSCAKDYVINSCDCKALYQLDYLLNKFNNLEEVVNNISIDPFNPKLTLFDSLVANEEEYDKISINDLDISTEIKKVLDKKIKHLSPVQALAVKEGLLENENLLIVSPTASGKTLIGELSGVNKALKKKKMIYLSPLVALANQKYMDFKNKYEKLGLKVSIKVGKNRIKSKDELYIPDVDIFDSDIIVATYEGLDFILRNGDKNRLLPLGVVIIDEINMLENEERGHRLNGLINRLLTIYPESQLIGLSATIKNAQEVADSFSMKLVEYDKRPVTIDRHLVPINDIENYNYIAEISKREFNNISSMGYHGQCIVFTDSRRKTQIISKALNKKGVKSRYYHAGLSYSQKLKVENEFLNQEISTVVTTSALSSGVDFPASCVIFESLRMGYEWISVNDFHQMCGRAGRPTYHDSANVYILSNEYENYDVAMDLLSSDVTDIDVLYDAYDVFEEVLSDICAIGEVNINQIHDVYDNLLIPIDVDEVLEVLSFNNMIDYNKDVNTYTPTEYGQAVSVSFINIDTAEYIKNSSHDNMLDLIVSIIRINNAYLDDKILNYLIHFENSYSIRLFSDKNKSIIFEGKNIIEDDFIQNKFINLNKDFMSCDCFENPFCGCFEREISKHIIMRRLQGWTPREITKEFKREYSVVIYSGDIFSYLDQVIRIIESIKRICKINNRKKLLKECDRLIKKIEG